MQRWVHHLFDELSWPVATLVLVVENLVILALALAAGALAVRLFANRRVAPLPPAVTRHELVLAGFAVLLNSAVTVAGLWLYREGIVDFRTDTGARAWLDVVILLLVMDTVMYVLHRVVHLPPLYGWIHAAHHRYQDPRPLTLFVLSPLEVLAFGGLWLLVITAIEVSFLGMAVYLALNVVFGTMGHLGVEPLPPWFRRLPLLGHLAGGGFHARHHADPTRNFGFYTRLWDRMLGTDAHEDARAP